MRQVSEANIECICLKNAIDTKSKEDVFFKSPGFYSPYIPSVFFLLKNY